MIVVCTHCRSIKLILNQVTLHQYWINVRSVLINLSLNQCSLNLGKVMSTMIVINYLFQHQFFLSVQGALFCLWWCQAIACVSVNEGAWLHRKGKRHYSDSASTLTVIPLSQGRPYNWFKNVTVFWWNDFRFKVTLLELNLKLSEIWFCVEVELVVRSSRGRSLVVNAEEYGFWQFDVDVGGDVPFKLSLTGYGGHLGVVKLPPVCRDSPSSNLPDLVLVRGIPSYFTLMQCWGSSWTNIA